MLGSGKRYKICVTLVCMLCESKKNTDTLCFKSSLLRPLES